MIFTVVAFSVGRFLRGHAGSQQQLPKNESRRKWVAWMKRCMDTGCLKTLKIWAIWSEKWIAQLMSFKVCQFWSSEGHLHWSLPNLLFTVLSLAYHLISNISNPSGNLLWIMTCVWELSFPPPPHTHTYQVGIMYMCESITMDLRGVGGLKVCAIYKLILSESMQEFLYNHSNVFWVHDV